MASFKTKDFIFVHFPKTGGMWFGDMWRQLKLGPVNKAPNLVGHKPAAYFKDWDKLPWVAVYRNPLNWYASLYNYHVKMNWYWDPRLKGTSFERFVEICLEKQPMSKIWHNMVVKPKQEFGALKAKPMKSGKLQLQLLPPPTYMIQYENMFEELEIVLHDILGYDVTKEQLEALPKQNAHNHPGLRDRIYNNNVPALTPRLRERILEADASIFEYYKNHDAVVAEW